MPRKRPDDMAARQALLLLWQRGYCCRGIADILNGADGANRDGKEFHPFRRDRVLSFLARRGHVHLIDDVLALANGETQSSPPFSTWAVWYYLKRSGAKCRPATPDRAQLSRDCARLYAARQGWGHLVPHHDETRDLKMGVLDLTAREADVLTALTAGPHTLSELALALGLGRLRFPHRGPSLLSRLLEFGLVGVVGVRVASLGQRPRGRRRRLYGLAEGITRHPIRHQRRPSVIERRFG